MGAQMQGPFLWSALLCFSLCISNGIEATGQKYIFIPLQMQQQQTAAPSGLSAARRLLQIDASLCFWRGDSCKTRYDSSHSDPEISQIGANDEMCANFSSKGDCIDVPECLWAEAVEECVSDVFDEIGACLQPEYQDFHRAIKCPLLFRKADCLSWAGCLWNETDAVCQVDEEALVAAIGESFDLAISLAQSAECLTSAPCAPPCALWGSEALGTECAYPPLVNVSAWYSTAATSTFCQYSSLGFGCVATPVDAPCTGVCEIDKEGFCNLSDKAAVEFLYESSEAEKAKWLDAIEACSAIEDPDECASFTN